MAAPRTLSPDLVIAAARAELDEHGTAGLSLRGTARRLGVSAPALYHYFDRLDDLVTAVVLEILQELRQTLDDAAAGAAGGPAGGQLLAVCHAFRSWALARPVDFQLAFEEPLPGYRTPLHISDAAAREPFLGLFDIFARAHTAGEMAVPPEYAVVPPSIAAELATWRAESGLDLPDDLICVIVAGWSRIHGLVSLEMFGQSTGIVGDAAAFYDYELRAFAQRIGLPMDNSPLHGGTS
jgi:AcrR family transcriptional regulator